MTSIRSDQTTVQSARAGLVTHFKLNARVFTDFTVITKNVRGVRHATKEERWVKSDRRPIGAGGFAQVWRWHEESNPSNVRAVKIIRKPQTHRGFQFDYEQELYALAALANVIEPESVLPGSC